MSELSSVLNSGTAFWVAGIAALGTLLKTLQSLFIFNEEHLQRRRLRRLGFFAQECKGNEDLKRLIDVARDEEVFHSLLGRSSTSEFRSALRQLLDTEKFNLKELRAAAIYLEVVNGAIAVVLGWKARILFWVSIIFVVTMTLYSVALLWTLLNKSSVETYLAAIVFWFFYLFFVWYMGSDAIDVRIAKRVRTKLLELKPID
jgi:hypothetical protein